jgi:hypothetical protein
VGKDLAGIIAFHGYFLPSRSARYCTREAKIEPMEEFLGKDEATIYYGIRADENRGGYNNATSKHITPSYPLKDLGIDLQGVYAINHAAGLKPPTFFWQSVFERVCKEAPEKFIRQTLTEWQFDALFSWRSRSNCYFCFNQQYREWIGLLEHYPDLFWKAEAMEHMGSEYTWNKNNKSLRQIYAERDRIKRKWVRKIVKALNGGQVGMFADPTSESDILSVTSCGLFCGK